MTEKLTAEPNLNNREPPACLEGEHAGREELQKDLRQQSVVALKVKES